MLMTMRRLPRLRLVKMDLTPERRGSWLSTRMSRGKSGNSKEGRLQGCYTARHANQRSVTTTGQSVYHLNAKAVTLQQYNLQLEKFNILVKAKNFLVFQGDVEGVASQDSKALARLVDRISGYV
jgi:hypothetical protein